MRNTTIDVPIEFVMTVYRDIQNMLSVHQTTGERIADRFDCDVIFAVMDVWEHTVHNSLEELEMIVFRSLVGAGLAALENNDDVQEQEPQQQQQQDQEQQQEAQFEQENQIDWSIYRNDAPPSNVRYIPAGAENDFDLFPPLNYAPIP